MAKKKKKKAAKKTATSNKLSKTTSKTPKANLVKKVASKSISGKGTASSKVLKSKGTKSRQKPQRAMSFDPRSVASFSDLPEEQDLSLIGLVSPDGNPGGSKIGRTWTFSVDLVAWKVHGGSIVREPALVLSRDISESKLESLMDSVSSLDIVSFTAKRPDKSLRPKAYPQPVRFELTKFGPKSNDAELLSLKDELQAPVGFQDSVFGKLKLDRQSQAFQAETSFQGTEISVSFDTMELDELKELLQYAKPLWKKRQAWFTNWQRKIYQYYSRSGRWQEDYGLTEATFYKLLGWPVGVEFIPDDGEFEYRLGGWCEELFSDHGIGAFGSTIDDMRVDF